MCLVLNLEENTVQPLWIKMGFWLQRASNPSLVYIFKQTLSCVNSCYCHWNYPLHMPHMGKIYRKTFSILLTVLQCESSTAAAGMSSISLFYTGPSLPRQPFPQGQWFPNCECGSSRSCRTVAVLRLWDHLQSTIP